MISLKILFTIRSNSEGLGKCEFGEGTQFNPLRSPNGVEPTPLVFTDLSLLPHQLLPPQRVTRLPTNLPQSLDLGQ